MLVKVGTARCEAIRWTNADLLSIGPLESNFRISSMALGQSHDCPSAIEVTLKIIGEIPTKNKTQLHMNHAYFVGCTVVNLPQ